MELGLTNRVALVTAASRGLGYACAMALAQEGARVAICSRSKTRIHAAASSIAKATGSRVIGIQTDLTKEEQLPQLVRHVESTLGSIEILISNTGNPPSGRFAITSDKAWALGTALCLRPPIVLCRHVLPGMRKRKSGRIIFISSTFALEPDEGYIVSSTMRAALGAFSKCLAREAGPDGVSVNVVCPGYCDTPLLRSLAQRHAVTLKKPFADILSAWAHLAPAGRLGRASDIGTLVALLASPVSGFIQGTAIPSDGGMLRGR